MSHHTTLSHHDPCRASLAHSSSRLFLTGLPSQCCSRVWSHSLPVSVCCWGGQDQGGCGYVHLFLAAAPGHIKPWALEVGMGAGGLCWQSRCPFVSLQQPAWLMHRAMRDHVLEPFPGNCWKKGGNGLAPTSHLRLEMPLSADTHPLYPEDLPQGCLGPSCSFLCFFPNRNHSRAPPAHSSPCWNPPNQGRTSAGLTRH